MSLFCLFSARRSNPTGTAAHDDKLASKARRRIPTFSSRSTKNGVHVFKSMINAATVVSPTRDGHHHIAAPAAPPTIRLSDADASCPPSSAAQAARDLRPGTRLLALSGPVSAHLRRVYDDLRGILAPELSRNRFRRFLERVQGEAVAPGVLEKESYKFEEFLETWFFRYHGDAQRPVAGPKDLSRPISNYFVSSSHNTYLLGNQFTSEASADAYRRVLKQNCRCIEIDVWNGSPRSSASRTPRTRSKSPHPQHRRNLSSISVTSTIRDAFESLEPVKHFRSARHSRTPSSSQPALGTEEGANSLDPKLLHERLSVGRARSLSRGESSTRSGSASSAQRTVRDEPIVMHAHNILKNDMSLGTYVGFREVCKAVAEAAFVTNDLPVIVSLEVHADHDQQEVMVDIMKEEWAGLLLDAPIEGYDPRLGLPTLGDLRRKILVKVKKAPSKTNVPKGTGNTLGLNLAAFNEDAASIMSEDDRTSSVTAATSSKGIKKVGICERLSALAIYTHSEHFNKSFEDRSAKTPSHIFSLDEKTVSEVYQSKHHEMFRHNRTFMMRCYPNAVDHWDSSNPDPAMCWRKGVQMVALNWQNWDEAMLLNSAMFAGQDGWVLKPEGYRSADAKAARCAADAGLHSTLDLRITVLAGQHISLPSMKRDVSRAAGAASAGVSGGPGYTSFKPSVKCELVIEKAGDRCPEAASEVVKVKEATLVRKTVARETDHPDWGSTGAVLNFESVKGVIEELSFVRLRIEDENASYYRGMRQQALGGNDNLAGWACVRLDRLQQGYRFVSLVDSHGHPTEGKLLVRVEKTLRKP